MEWGRCLQPLWPLSSLEQLLGFLEPMFLGVDNHCNPPWRV